MSKRKVTTETADAYEIAVDGLFRIAVADGLAAIHLVDHGVYVRPVDELAAVLEAFDAVE